MKNYLRDFWDFLVNQFRTTEDVIEPMTVDYGTLVEEETVKELNTIDENFDDVPTLIPIRPSRLSARELRLRNQIKLVEDELDVETHPIRAELLKRRLFDLREAKERVQVE